jgi:predicted nucleotidyltransferase
MVSITEIETLAQRIAENFNPMKIVLFGSYARGTATPDSDVDLLVVMDFEGSSARKAAEIRFTLNPHFALDILVRTPETIEARLAVDDFFLREIMEEGIVLYEAEYARVGE